MGLQLCEQLLFRNRARVTKELSQLKNTVLELCRDTSDLEESQNFPELSDQELDKLLLDRLDNLQNNYGVLTKLEIVGQERQIPSQLKRGIIEIVHEALTNVGKHANANATKVRLELKRDRAVAEIEDDGRGFKLESGIEKSRTLGHLGLIQMERQAKTLGGTLEINTYPGQGTKLVVSVPLPDKSTNFRQ